MPREEPFFRKCCFCIPLKSCLQVWSCVKTMADISLAVFLTILVLLLSQYDELFVKRFTLAHAFIIVIIVLVIDSVFMVVLTIGLCTNNIRTLRVILYYNIYSACMGAVCFIGFLIYIFVNLHTTHEEALIATCVVSEFVNTALDVCIIFTLKSEMIKLRNKQQYEFVQMPTLVAEEEEPKEPAEPFQSDADNSEVFIP